MGLPIDKLICASNDNKVLYDFFETGCYDRNREFILTNSPSMDILISSNLERLIYKIAENDSEKNAELMAELAKDGKYTITDSMRKYKKDTNDDKVTVIASTASPFKFTRSVMNAINPAYDKLGDFELVDELSKIGNVKVPNAIEEIRNAEIRHNNLCNVDEMESVVKKFLNM